MKKLFFILAIALLCFSQSQARMTAVVVGGQGAAAGGCTGTYGNSNTSEAGYYGSSTNSTILYSITVDCTGTPASINFRAKYGTGNVKFLIYAESGGEPTGSPLYVSDPVAIGNPSSTTTITDSACDYELTSGTYFVGVVFDTSSRAYYSSATGGTTFYNTVAGTYDSPGAWNTGTDTAAAYTMTIWMTF